MAPPAHPIPEPTSQSVESFSLGGGLPLQPALQLGILRTAAKHVALIRRQLSGSCQLGGPPLLQALAPLALPAQAARLPEDLTLKCARQILLGYPVLGVGMGVAVAHPIAKGLAIAVGVAQVGGHLLTVGAAHAFEGIEETQHAVALLRSRQVESCLGQRVKPLRQSHSLEAGRAGFHHHHCLGIG